jgi:hypothetical protein
VPGDTRDPRRRPAVDCRTADRSLASDEADALQQLVARSGGGARVACPAIRAIPGVGRQVDPCSLPLTEESLVQHFTRGAYAAE